MLASICVNLSRWLIHATELLTFEIGIRKKSYPNKMHEKNNLVSQCRYFIANFSLIYVRTTWLVCNGRFRLLRILNTTTSMLFGRVIEISKYHGSCIQQRQ